MKFYDCHTAPSPRLVRMFIAEKNVKVKTIEVDLRNFEHLTPEFRAINPHCTVPVIETSNGTIITSTQGCWRYLEETKEDPPLLGKTPEEKAMIADLIWHIEMDGLQAVAEGLRNSAPRLKDRAVTGPENYAQIPDLASRGKVRARRFLESLEALIGDNEFILGDQFTAVDIFTFVIVEFAGWLKLDLPETDINSKGWYQRVISRPSSKL